MSRVGTPSKLLRAAGLLVLLAVVTPAVSGAEALCLSLADKGAGATQLLADGDGIGGTGLAGDDDGIGGTGLGGDDDGIGGTGFEDDKAGTLRAGYQGMSDVSLDRIRATGTLGGTRDGGKSAIYGTITSLGRVCLNGLHIGFDAGTVVEESGEPVSPDVLRVGHVVSVDLEEVGTTHYALGVSLRPVIEGPVTGIDAEAGVLEVMGEAVAMGATVMIEDEDEGTPITLDAIEEGDSVVVHGLRTPDGGVLATYVGRRARSDVASVRGLAEPMDGSADGVALRIGRVRVGTVCGAEAPAGRWIQATGRWDVASASLADARLVETPAGQVELELGGAEHESHPGRKPGVRHHLGQWAPNPTR